MPPRCVSAGGLARRERARSGRLGLAVRRRRGLRRAAARRSIGRGAGLRRGLAAGPGAADGQEHDRQRPAASRPIATTFLDGTWPKPGMSSVGVPGMLSQSVLKLLGDPPALGASFAAAEPAAALDEAAPPRAAGWPGGLASGRGRRRRRVMLCGVLGMLGGLGRGVAEAGGAGAGLPGRAGVARTAWATSPARRAGRPWRARWWRTAVVRRGAGPWPVVTSRRDGDGADEGRPWRPRRRRGAHSGRRRSTPAGRGAGPRDWAPAPSDRSSGWLAAEFSAAARRGRRRRAKQLGRGGAAALALDIGGGGALSCGGGPPQAASARRPSAVTAARAIARGEGRALAGVILVIWRLSSTADGPRGQSAPIADWRPSNTLWHGESISLTSRRKFNSPDARTIVRIKAYNVRGCEAGVAA